MGDSPVRSYVPPEGYGQLNSYPSGNQDYANIYADSKNVYGSGSGSVSGTVYADSLSSNGVDTAYGESLSPAYRLPGSPDQYGLSGHSDTYILHGQHSTDKDSLDSWPAVSQPDNQLTQEG